MSSPPIARIQINRLPTDQDPHCFPLLANVYNIGSLRFNCIIKIMNRGEESVLTCSHINTTFVLNTKLHAQEWNKCLNKPSLHMSVGVCIRYIYVLIH